MASESGQEKVTFTGHRGRQQIAKALHGGFFDKRRHIFPLYQKEPAPHIRRRPIYESLHEFNIMSETVRMLLIAEECLTVAYSPQARVL